MRFKISIMTALALGLAMATAMAADVTGTWMTETEGRKGQLVFNLKADGNNLTGTVAFRTGEPYPISEGKIDGDNISFVVEVSFGDNKIKMNYQGKVTGDEMELTIENMEGAKPKRDDGSEGGERPPMIAKRVK
jgi:opacity protein-like surface antigen